jgi:hypothetical protein
MLPLPLCSFYSVIKTENGVKLRGGENPNLRKGVDEKQKVMNPIAGIVPKKDLKRFKKKDEEASQNKKALVTTKSWAFESRRVPRQMAGRAPARRRRKRSIEKSFF